jgi:hypothetical protein
MNNYHKVLSFDVGIINLAYCILEINKIENTFKILKWDIINLVDNKNKCCFIKRTKEQCDTTATRMLKFNKSNVDYYCTSHISKAVINTKDINILWHLVENNNIVKCELCTKKGYYMTDIIQGQYCRVHQKTISRKHNIICDSKKCDNMITKAFYLNNEIEIGWCDKHYDVDFKLYINKITKKISQKSNKISRLELCLSLIKKFDAIPELLQVDKVLIENQPSYINPTMKSISNFIFSYFIRKGIYEKNISHSTITDVCFCSPSNKIKVGGSKANSKIENTQNNKVYKVTKKLGVKLCKALINDNDTYIQLLNNHKKKDDLADAFLQGFIMNFSTLPEHYANKIKNLYIDVDNVQEKTNTNKKVYTQYKKNEFNT